MSSAGIDESNGNGKLILLPHDSFKTASILRKKLKEKYRLKNLGVLIVGSRTLPLRKGVLGSTLGYSGFKGLRECKGTKDIFGRAFKFSRTNIADSLATSAVLTMGEGKEKQPLALITEALVEFSEKINRQELKIKLEDDMYRPLFSKLPR